MPPRLAPKSTPSAPTSDWEKYEIDTKIFNLVQQGLAAEKKKDLEEATAKFEAAAKLGSLFAIGKLGQIFSEQISPPQYKKAAYWYRRGVALGDSDSAWDLAMHYSALRNKARYRHWLCVASEMGDQSAFKELGGEYWWKKHGGPMRR